MIETKKSDELEEIVESEKIEITEGEFMIGLQESYKKTYSLVTKYERMCTNLKQTATDVKFYKEQNQAITYYVDDESALSYRIICKNKVGF